MANHPFGPLTRSAAAHDDLDLAVWSVGYQLQQGKLPEALDMLGFATAQLDATRAAIVKDLRTAGTSWSVIGEYLGITRQAAQQRFAPTPTYITRPRTPADPDAGYRLPLD